MKRLSHFLTLVAVFAVGACASTSVSGPTHAVLAPPDIALLDSVQHRTFDFFWERSDARTGLTPDRWPTPSFSSIAAVGFALTAYPVGAERGWITREQAAERTLTTLKFFWESPQGPSAE